MFYVNDVINRIQDRGKKKTVRTTCSYVKGFHILPTEIFISFPLFSKLKSVAFSNNFNLLVFSHFPFRALQFNYYNLSQQMHTVSLQLQ